MKTIEKIIVKYSQEGHYMYPGDTWEEKRNIENKKDLLKFCKEMYKESGMGFNNYPFNSLFSFNSITFQKQKIIIDDKYNRFHGKKQDCVNPEYFNEVKLEFNKWLDAIKERLPRLREARKKRLKEEKEYQKFKELSLKYN